MSRGLWHTRRFRAWVARHSTMRHGRVQVVATGEPLAVTAGLLRPRVVVSTGLVARLTEAELRAVLAHEREHARRRDPLRALAARVFADHLWFLPIARDLRERAHAWYELCADWAAVHQVGRQTVASALLRVATMAHHQATAASTVDAVTAIYAEPRLLAARITQLESGQPPLPVALPAVRAGLSVLGALAFVAAVAGAWTYMLMACPSGMPM